MGYIGEEAAMFSTPTVIWLKDGRVAKAVPEDVPVGSNGSVMTNLSFIFEASDAGLYQCIFNDSNSEIYAAIPLCLDTGESDGEIAVFIIIVSSLN